MDAIKKTITKGNVDKIIELIRGLDFSKPWRIQLSEYKFTRSDAQNKRYWKLIKAIGGYLGYEADEMHQLMKYKFLSEEIIIKNEKILNIRNTPELNTKEMVEYQEDIQDWARPYGFKFIEEEHG